MTTTHVHFWAIAPASGPTSKGVCRECGEERIFRNYFDEETPYETWHIKPPKDYAPPVERTNVVWR